MNRALIALGCLVWLPRVLWAQADTTAPALRLRFEVPPFVLTEPAALRAPWMGSPRLPPAVHAAAFDSTVSATLAAARAEQRRGFRLRQIYGEQVAAAADTLAPAPEPGAEPVTEPGAEPGRPGEPSRRRGLLGLPTDYADLTVDGQARLEIRTNRVREERCTPALSLDPNSACRGGFKPPSLDNQLNLRASGLLGRRIHLNVDLDTERDFSANNNVQVYYEGLEDEIVRRVDVGTVVFQPPRSRFITAGVPSSNFGVNATFEVGPVQLQTLAATQKGSVIAERTYTVGETTTQPQERQLRDLDFESGRFFWVVDPDSLAGFPAVDILNQASLTLAPTYQPAQVRIYRYRAAIAKSGTNPNIGGITALARRTDSPQQFGPARWELLIQGSDYYLDPSGRWIVLATKLDQSDYLAVSYRTAAGTTIGTFPEVDRGTGSVGGLPQARDTLELIVQPQQTPDLPTFRYEMRQIYRVAGADLSTPSLQVGITLNRSERPQSGGGQTYLQQLGLAVPTDPTVFDRSTRLFPRQQDTEAADVVHDSYIVFPNLQPFADPARLTTDERSDSLYRIPLFLLTSQGPPAKFAVQLDYQATGGGDRSTLSLNALQIREGSEELSVGGRKLERHVDYDISYDVGQVTFLDPDALFGSNGSAQVTARFEEQGQFAVAPTTILGLTTRYSLGDRGSINLIGLYQREASAFNRPALGFEATANLIGGINTELQFKPTWLTRLLNGLTTKSSTAPSQLRLAGEVAFSKPDPSRSGQAYLEEFEGETGLPVSLRESQWEFGSRPQQATGLEDIGFGGGLELDDAVALTWQNLVPACNGCNQALDIRPQQIDTLIRVAGRGEEVETVMYLTLHADTAGGIVQTNNSSRWTLPARPNRPRWRSMATSLSPTGLDLTREEYLEFWLLQPTDMSADSAHLRLVVDLGTVSEDAVAFAPDSLIPSGSDTTYRGRQFIGLGQLDTERSSIGIFNSETDDIGILGDRPPSIAVAGGTPLADFPLCQRVLSSSVPVFPWGDLSARCTNGNGVLDTEDLNGDNVLDGTGSNENVFRYVVDLAADSFFVRDGVSSAPDAQGRRSTWKLYRVPLRQPSATLNTPTLRLVQDLRLTLAAPPDNGGPDVVARVAMARLRFVGSPWVRRAETPIAGLNGSAGLPGASISVSTVSTENLLDLGYTSPPGVFDQVDRRGGDRASQGTQINERSLRLVAGDLQQNERAEAYLRLPSGPQSVLNYRQLRVWMRGRGPGWQEGDLQAFIKVGSDDQNFYLYRAGARTDTWDPEFAIDLEVWRRLRTDIENRWLSGQPASGNADCGGVSDPEAYVACDGPYLVQVRSPGINPPNLAAIQEISAGIFRAGQTVSVPEAELWVDDIRLSDPVSETGLAGSLDATLNASDVATVNLSYINQNGQFRQLNQDPTYRGRGVLQANSSIRLDRFLPTSLGLAMPLTVNYARTSVNPELLTGTDIRAGALPGLRTPENRSATFGLTVRRSEVGKSWLVKGLVDPLAVSASLTNGSAATELSEVSSKNYNVNLGYNLQLKRKGFRLPLGGLVKALPKFIRQSDAGKALERADLSLAPTRLSLSSGLSRDRAEATAFLVPVARSDDANLTPTLALNHLWRNAAGLSWQPFSMLNLSSDLVSTRDLRVYPDSSPLGRLAYAERRFLVGIPVGVERDRSLSSVFALTPRLASWLRPRLLSSSSFVLSRTLASRDPVRADGDSGAFILPQTLNNARTNEIGGSVDLGRALRGLTGDSSTVGRAVARVRPLDLSTRLTRSSTYDLSAFDPGLGYQLAFGGLDDFFTRDGAPALGVSETRTATVTSGADLPFGFTVNLSHALTRTTRFQRVGDIYLQTETNQREWPVGNARWSRTLAKGPFTVLALGAAFRHREGSSVQASRAEGGAGALTRISSSSFTPDLQVGLRNGVVMTLGLSRTGQDNVSNGSNTQLDQNDFTGSLNYAFRMPRSIGRSRRLVRSSLAYQYTMAKSCLQQASDTTCEVISDVRRREVRGGLDTDLLQSLTGGLQLNYSINDARHLSRRTSQISIVASFQLSLFAGDYR